jgi:hypothetical protein
MYNLFGWLGGVDDRNAREFIALKIIIFRFFMRILGQSENHIRGSQVQTL